MHVRMKKKTNAVALNLESQFQGNNIADFCSKREVNETFRMFLREDIFHNLDEPATHNSINQEIKKLSNKKSPGVSRNFRDLRHSGIS